MGVSAIINNGEIVKSAAETAYSESSSSGTGTVGKDQFLQLLVAQMKFQDPLEPTDNTEWVSQYATFSELEEMQNMAGSLELSRASGLVGQTVIIETVDSAGRNLTVQGNVDYVTYENGKAYLSIDGGLYSLDNLSKVVDNTYLNAYKIAGEFTGLLSKLPKLSELTKEDKSSVQELVDLYNSMDSYQRDFLSEDTLVTFSKYLDQMDLLTKEDNEE